MNDKNEAAMQLFLSSQNVLGRELESRKITKPRAPMNNFDGQYAALKFRMISEGRLHADASCRQPESACVLVKDPVAADEFSYRDAAR